MKISTQTKFFFSHFLAIILVSGSIGSYFYNNALNDLHKSLQSRLQNSAALLSQVFDAREMTRFTAKEDMKHPEYQQKRAQLRDLVATNEDIAFIYIMRRDPQNRVFFVLDSDDDPAPPGYQYQEQIPELMRGFWEPSVDNEITVDEWGSFLSGYAPLKNGRGQYLVGIDMRANQVDDKFLQLRMTGAISLLLSIVLALIFSHLLAIHFNRRISRLVDRCSDIAQQRLDEALGQTRGDELDRLNSAFDAMSSHLAFLRERQEHENKALRASHEQEIRTLHDQIQTLEKTTEKPGKD